VVSTTGQGGWPMSVFLTPAGKPFYGGTYFPPTRRQNLPAFREVLETISHLWSTDRAGILFSSEELAKSLQPHLAAQPGAQELTPALLQQVIRTIAQAYDWQDGGWGGAPKFPQPMLIEFLLRQASRADQTSHKMALHALRSMAQGGMYDVLGGGFARYSVDPTWLIPHFEKMLYDNAQLALVYLHAYQLTGDAFFKEVCESSLDFVLRELTHKDGGFYSSLDADSEGVEGKYYLWTAQEIRSALANPGDVDLFMAAYGVIEQGNFDDHTILRRARTNEELMQQFSLDVATVHTRLEILHRQMLAVRGTRVHPSTDDKVLLSWNALMLTAFAEAGRALDRSDYLQAAIRNAHFMLEHMLTEGGLVRSWREGVANQPAFLEDYAGLALALLSLYQSDPDSRWYRTAIELLHQVLAHFSDPAGGFFDTPDHHEELLYRPKDLQDNATPSGNALITMVLLRLATYEGNSQWRELAEKMLSSNLGMMLPFPSAFAQWWCAADFALGPVHEVAILGDLSDPATQRLLQPLWQGYHPRQVLAISPYPVAAGSPALLEHRPLLNGLSTAYVCQDFVCQQPVNEPQVMLAQLAS
jgi:uncharacterized protein YyaL (SSP411 family)